VTVHLRDGDRERQLLRTSLLGSSFASCEDPRIHVGLGASAQVSGISVRWASGVTEEFPGTGDGRVFRLVEGTGRVARLK
jgi:hypothetical protein